MEVILLEKVGRVGNVGDKINVKAGYARNFLFPFAKAIPATKENLADFEARKAELMKAAAEKQAAAQARADKLNGIEIRIEGGFEVGIEICFEGREQDGQQIGEQIDRRGRKKERGRTGRRKGHGKEG